jgi:heterotetrameric sarcosine oxidase gamma subunit
VYVVELIAKTACEGLLPVSIGTCELSEIVPLVITSIAPARGNEAAVSAALKKAHGMSFPAANRETGKGGARCVWMGPGQAFLVGPEAKIIPGAAMTDQSDGWAMMQIEGVDCEAVLARLVPIDLRVTSFKRGHTARTKLNHVPLSITRTGVNRLELMVFRSMAKTVIEEVSLAMKSVAELDNLRGE